MAIIHMTGNYDIVFENGTVNKMEKATFPDGAFCPFEYNTSEHRTLENAIIIYSTHHGLCLYEREYNGYHDSDFYMMVWNPERSEPQEICFATTRGWTYPCYGSRADATPEVMAAYEAWKSEQIRRNRILARWQARKLRRLNAAKCGITTTQYDRLRNCYDNQTFERILKLLASKLRSSFRIKLANQIRVWLNDSTPKYNTPLSPRQLPYV